MPSTALGVDVARDVVALIDDQTLFACLFGLVGKHRAEQAGTNDQIIILFHACYSLFCRSCFLGVVFFWDAIILVDGILNAGCGPPPG